VRELGLSATRVTAEGVRALVSSPHAGGLKSLDLSDTLIGPGGLRVLAECTRLGRLTYLAVGGLAQVEGLTEDDVRLLANAPLLDRLTSLKLGLSSEDDGKAALKGLAASSRLGRLVTLDLSDSPFDEECARILVTSPSLGRLRCLRVGWWSAATDSIRKVLHERWGPRFRLVSH
jgi:hypothetical protein